MWPSTGGRGRLGLGGATTDENLYPTGTAHGGPPTLHKPAAGSGGGSGSGGAMTPGNGAKAAARKALGLLGSGNSMLEDQARIKQQGGGGGGKDVGGSGLAARPRRALGEITNRVAPPSASKAPGGGGSSSSSSSLGLNKPSAATVPSGGFHKGSAGRTKIAPPSAVPATALADLPSFSDDEEEVDDVELPAGRLGDDEDRLVAQKRAAKEAEEDAGFLRKVNRLLCSSRREAEDLEEEDDEMVDDVVGMMDAALGVGEDDAVPPPKAGDDGSSSLGSVLDDLDLLVDF